MLILSLAILLDSIISSNSVCVDSFGYSGWMIISFADIIHFISFLPILTILISFCSLVTLAMTFETKFHKQTRQGSKKVDLFYYIEIKDFCSEKPWAKLLNNRTEDIGNI